jgi:hypothetical protein
LPLTVRQASAKQIRIVLLRSAARMGVRAVYALFAAAAV